MARENRHLTHETKRTPEGEVSLELLLLSETCHIALVVLSMAHDLQTISREGVCRLETCRRRGRTLHLDVLAAVWALHRAALS